MVIIHTDDGPVTVHSNGNTVLKGTEPLNTFWLGTYDLAELFSISAGSDPEALKKLAYVMEHGHRFRMDDQLDRTIVNDEEPF